MFLRIEGNQVAIEWTETSRDLRLVVGLERDDVEAISADGDGSRVLSRDGECLDQLAGAHIDHRDLILRRQRDVGFVIAGEGNAHGLVKAGRPGDRVEVLHRGDDLKTGGTRRIGIDHTHRIRDVIRDPDFPAVRPNREPHRVDADVDTRDDGITGRVDDIDGVGRRVHHEDVAAAHHNRRRVRTHERGMSDIVEGNLLGVRDGESRETHAGDQNPGPQPAQCVRHQFRPLLHVGCRRP